MKICLDWSLLVLSRLFPKRLVRFLSLSLCFSFSIYVECKQPRMSVESIFYISPAGNEPQNGISRPYISSQFPSMGERLFYSPYPFYYALFNSGGHRISFVPFSPLRVFSSSLHFFFS